MSTITETAWPDGFVDFDLGQLKVHPNLVSHFLARGWHTLDNILSDSDVSVTEVRDVRDNCTIELQKPDSTKHLRVYLKRHRDHQRPHEAQAEADAVERCRQAGVACMHIAAVGKRIDSSQGDWHSFFMSVEVGNGKSAYDLAEEYCNFSAENRQQKLNGLLSEVARVLVQLHSAGLFHRDCYLQHFIVESNDESKLTLRLIDLQGTRKLAGSKALYAQIKDLEHLAHSMRSLGLSHHELKAWYQIYFSELSRHKSQKTSEFLIRNIVILRGIWRRQKNRISRLKRACQKFL